MKKEVMEKWVKALKSGEYKQTKEALRDSDGYCCLGVLCDISNLSKWDKNKYMGDDAVLPVEVKDFAGLKSVSPRVRCENGMAGLAVLNDKGKSFKDIAELIENNYEHL